MKMLKTGKKIAFCRHYYNYILKKAFVITIPLSIIKEIKTNQLSIKITVVFCVLKYPFEESRVIQ